MKNRLSASAFIFRCLSVDNNPKRQLSLRSVINSERLDWAAVLSTANEQLISPALWVSLREKGLDSALPVDVRDYLAEIYRLNRIRNEHLRSQTIEIVRALNAGGVAPVLLKGAACLFTDTYDDFGSRVMLDLDILVPHEDAQRCWNLLRDLDYSPIQSDHDFSHHHHLDPLHRSGEYATVELHLEGTAGEAKQMLSTQQIWANCLPVEDLGLAMYVPDPTSRVMHNLLHEAVQHGAYYNNHTESLRSLHELAVTATRYRGCVDWERIRSSFERNDKARILDAWLYLSYRLFSAHLPDGMRASPLAIEYHLRWAVRWGWGRVFGHAA